MRKKDIKEFNEKVDEIWDLRAEIEKLNKKLYIYKQALEITRDFYGKKLMELEGRRLLLDHPDVVVEDIVWDSVEDLKYPENLKYRRYKFIYGIKGESQ